MMAELAVTHLAWQQDSTGSSGAADTNTEKAHFCTTAHGDDKGLTVGTVQPQSH
jgi:hypothetical protein